MTIPEPIRLTDLDGVLSNEQRAELGCYRQAGPETDLKLEMWENLERMRALDTPRGGVPNRHGAPRGWSMGVLCAGLIAGIVLALLARGPARVDVRPKSAPEPALRGQAPVSPVGAAKTHPAAAAVTEGAAETEARPSVATSKPRRTRAGAGRAGGDALEELKLLTRARRMLPSRPQTTLALSGEHAQLYPRGALAEEREVLAIEALLKLGRASEARQRARAFMRQFSGSGQRARLNALLEQGTKP
jgi:hypothetical protein